MEALSAHHGRGEMQMKTITILFSALICVFGLTGCVPAPGAGGPGRPIAAYIADDVTKAEITHRAGGTVTEWTRYRATNLTR